MEKPCKFSSVGTSSDGRDRVRYQGKIWYTHRLAWVRAFGPIPDGLFVCHHCDVSNCIEPTHLFLGTQKDNMRDAAKKGRIRNRYTDVTHCKNGHEFTQRNTSLYSNGKRKCRACQRVMNRRRSY